MGLLTLQDRRERRDLIVLFKIVKGKEMIDRTDLVTMVTNETRHTGEHSRRLEKVDARWMTKSSAFLTEQWVWNGLSEEIVEGDSIHRFKNKLDKFRYGDRV